MTNAYNVMTSKMAFLWENRTEDLPYESPYEALIVASIIEKEMGVEYEAPEIAGVFVNRLNANMRLQSDPTVIYGMQDSFKGNIRKKDLRADTSHNTYTRKGIPPSPIALPSLVALVAALNPATTGYYYFVAKGASLKIINGDLPPSSKVTSLRLPAASAIIFFPVPLSPVKEILATLGCRVKYWPTR